MKRRRKVAGARAPAGQGSTSETLFRGEHTAAGEFRCPVDHPNFPREGAMHAYEVVFPRTAVRIRRADVPEFVADANLVTLYNRGQQYERAAIDRRGDNSDWLAVDEATARELAAHFDPATAEAAAPLRFACAPGTPALALRQRRLFARMRAPELDALGIEEEILELFRRVLGQAHAAEGTLFAAPAAPHSDAVERARELLGVHFREPWSLGDLARACGVSSFRLAHLFRRATGSSLHAWRIRLRLHAALEVLRDSPGCDLTGLALDLGFSSHSHFSASFRRGFGVTPSELRPLRAAAYQRSNIPMDRTAARG